MGEVGLEFSLFKVSSWLISMCSECCMFVDKMECSVATDMYFLSIRYSPTRVEIHWLG